MIYPSENRFDTKTIVYDQNAYDKKYFCAYCGKEITPYTEIFDRYEECTYYHCTCPDAMKERKLQIEIMELNDKIESVKRQFPPVKYKVITVQQITKIE